ncbi:MAG: tetratricopeptide repeat protein [Balneolales bacterium]|nr:tetratricopeptide repeat protein [Balneolales bacterium]
MHTIAARLTPFILIFGLFLFGCSQTENLYNAKSAFEAANMSEALRYANQATMAKPENPEAHLLKAEIIANMVVNYQPKDRYSLYNDMAESLQKAIQFKDNAPDADISGRAFQLTDTAYQRETQAADNILISSEQLTDDNRNTAIAHLNNAVAIKEDEARVFDMLFELHYEMGQIQQAAEVLERMELSGFTSARHLTSLGYLLYQLEEYDRAIPHLYRSWNEGLGPINSGRGLANALLQTGNYADAMEVLERLSRLDAQTVESKLGYGRIMAQSGLDLLGQLLDGDQFGEMSFDEITELYETALSQLETAESEFAAALILNQDYLLTNKTIGLYHRNVAFRLLDVFSLHPGLSSEEAEESLEEHFYQSLNHLEYVAEMENSSVIWSALADVYTQLEMYDEAEQARSNIVLP